MRELLADLERLRRGGPVGRAVVVDVRGSAPRPAGAVLLATESQRFAGSLAGGCVEGASVDDVVSALRDGTPRVTAHPLHDRGGDDPRLACGGTLRVLVEPCVRPELVEMAMSDQGGVLATVLEGGALGVGFAVAPDGAVRRLGTTGEPSSAASGPEPHAAALRDAALAAWHEGASRVAAIRAAPGAQGPSGAQAAVETFLEVVPPRPRIVVYGATDVAAALVAMARVLGFAVVVADARAAFLDAERFAAADALVRAWPEEAFARIGLDARTSVVVLTHDGKLDVPALRAALASPAPYVGLMGSRKTQALRRAALLAEGAAEADVARIHGPVGLDLGGRTAAELALSILAEIVACRRGAGAARTGALR